MVFIPSNYFLSRNSIYDALLHQLISDQTTPFSDIIYTYIITEQHGIVGS
jgi:hypothetical protein